MRRTPNICWLLANVAIVMLHGVGVYAQNPQTMGPYPPANLWVTYPVTWVPANDPVPGSVRQQRDQYFDELIGLGVPLTPVNVRSRGFSEGGVPFQSNKKYHNCQTGQL
jgi:hypothetical protein